MTITPHGSSTTTTLHHGDCLDIMRELPDNSVDAIVTDPPYGLGFMGKEWDDLPPGLPWARECLRVLKPGGHLLAFGGTRTWHRLACAVEDAGFEVRDSIAWMYGSGFPKSLDVSKAIDKAADYRLQAAVRRAAVAAVETAGLTLPGNSRHDWTVGEHAPGDKWWAEFQTWLPDLTDEDRERVEGEIVATISKTAGWFTRGDIYDVTAPATDDARTWQGWGTALKPAFEPVVVARKPLAGTVAANVLAHGTGALNVDGCRVASDEDTARAPAVVRDTAAPFGVGLAMGGNGSPLGRWPANVVLDESQAAALDQQSGVQRDGTAVQRNGGGRRIGNTVYSGSNDGEAVPDEGYGGEGGASRFFYTAKADATERVRINGTAHPTVKPLALMRWLVRLVTPPGGTVLEPFAGSGTTVEACILEGFRCIAIEREADYLPLIMQRINRRVDPVAAVAASGEDGGLFDLLDADTA